MAINFTKKHSILVTLTLIASVTAYGFMDASSIDSMTSLLSQGLQSDYAKMSFAFTMAAWVHSGRMKKEIKANFTELTAAINAVASAFKKDLEAQSKIIQDQTNLLAATISRVEVLETVGKPNNKTE